MTRFLLAVPLLLIASAVFCPAGAGDASPGRFGGFCGQIRGFPNGRTLGFLQSRAVPDIRCASVFGDRRTRRMVRRNSSAGRARHS